MTTYQHLDSLERALFDMVATGVETRDETADKIERFFRDGDMATGFGRLVGTDEVERFYLEHRVAICAALDDYHGVTGENLYGLLQRAAKAYGRDDAGSIVSVLVWTACTTVIKKMLSRWEHTGDDDPTFTRASDAGIGSL
ncbi:MAG: hypothetical protein NVS4B8_23260 [Herpetosiphon sp.]